MPPGMVFRHYLAQTLDGRYQFQRRQRSFLDFEADRQIIARSIGTQGRADELVQINECPQTTPSGHRPEPTQTGHSAQANPLKRGPLEQGLSQRPFWRAHRIEMRGTTRVLEPAAAAAVVVAAGPGRLP